MTDIAEDWDGMCSNCGSKDLEIDDTDENFLWCHGCGACMKNINKYTREDK